MFLTLSNTGCFIASSIVILFLGSNTNVFSRKSYHSGKQYENISLGLFLSYLGSDFRYFKATSSVTKDIYSGDGVPTNCRIFDLHKSTFTSGHLLNEENHFLSCKCSLCFLLEETVGSTLFLQIELFLVLISESFCSTCAMK